MHEDRTQSEVILASRPDRRSINHPGERLSGSTTRKVFAVKIFEVEGSVYRRRRNIGDPYPRRGAKVAEREIDERIDGQLAVEASTPSHQIADARGEHEAASQRRALRSLVLSI